MRARYLGSNSGEGGSPTLFELDNGGFGVQGYIITDRQALSDIGEIPEGETVVEVPRELLRFADSPLPFDPRRNRQRETSTEGGGPALTLVSGPAFVDLFRTFDHTARRLEVRERYDSPSEHEPFQRFLAGDSEDAGWLQNWLGIIRQATKEGKIFQRVRVVSIPPSDYTRFGLSISQHNIEAGEDIRYLDRQYADGLPDEDFWVFDSRRVARLQFTLDDKLLGAEIITDPAIVVACMAALDDARHRSSSREEFAARTAG